MNYNIYQSHYKHPSNIYMSISLNLLLKLFFHSEEITTITILPFSKQYVYLHLIINSFLHTLIKCNFSY